MKGFILGAVFLISASASAMHPASQFVQDTFERGKQILEMKNESARLRGMCTLMKQRLSSAYMASVWLGDFARLERERAAAQQFQNLIPSILITKAVDAIGGGDREGGNFAVADTARSRGNGYWEVGVAIRTAAGKTYSGKALVYQSNTSYVLVDAEYMGFSAVNYQAREYQGVLRREYNRDPNRSMPVSALINQITSEPGFIRCP